MDKLLDIIMRFLYANEKDMDSERAEIIRYGLEIFLIKTSFSAAALIIGALMHSFAECVIFLICFSLLRSSAGGYHARTSTQCFVGSMLIFAFVLGLLKLTSVLSAVPLVLSWFVVPSSAIIFITAPIDSENKLLSSEEKAVFRKKTHILLLCELMAAAVLMFFKAAEFSCAVILAVIITAVFMAAVPQKKEKPFC